jgi:hypothetical protein
VAGRDVSENTFSNVIDQRRTEMSVKLKVLKDLQYSKWLLLCIYMQLGI